MKIAIKVLLTVLSLSNIGTSMADAAHRDDHCIFPRFNVLVKRDLYARNSAIGGSVAVGTHAEFKDYEIGVMRYGGKQKKCYHPPKRTCHYEEEDHKICDEKKECSMYDDFGAANYEEHELNDLFHYEYDYPVDDYHKPHRVYPHDFTLIVNERLTLRKTDVFNGGIAFGESISIDTGFTHLVGKGCPIVRKKDLIDFDRIHTKLNADSERLSNLESTSTVFVSGPALEIQFNGARDVEVVKINGTDLRAVDYIVVRRPPRKGAAIIMNVNDRDIRLSCLFMEDLAPYQHQIVWNFFEATRLHISGTAWRGSILAQNAFFTNEAGIIWGQVAAGVWGSQERPGSMAVQNVQFSPKRCPVIP